MTTDYTILSLADVGTELYAIASDAQSVFGRLDERQLNWRPDAASWSVAQCFDHLLKANREMFQAVDAVTDGAPQRTAWQRLPVLPGVFGRMLIKSQMPEAKRKLQRARWLPAHRDARAPALRASAARDPGTCISVVGVAETRRRLHPCH